MYLGNDAVETSIIFDYLDKTLEITHLQITLSIGCFQCHFIARDACTYFVFLSILNFPHTFSLPITGLMTVVEKLLFYSAGMNSVYTLYGCNYVLFSRKLLSHK